MVEVSEVLGVDVGIKKTGIARASNVARLAEPLMSQPTEDTVAALAKYAAEHRVEAIAVGLPRNLAGGETPQTTWVRDWVDQAKTKIEAPLYWQDEALTSKLAEAEVQKSKIKNQGYDDHTLAAAAILQDFLDSPETDRIMA